MAIEQRVQGRSELCAGVDPSGLDRAALAIEDGERARPRSLDVEADEPAAEAAATGH